MIRVMVVDDSPVVRAFLVQILNEAPGIHVVGTAENGEEAVQLADRWQPDVMTMDIHMPKLNGLEATRQIMERHPLPIIIVSGTTEPGDVDATFRAMDAGAVAFLLRPAGFGHPNHEADVEKLLQTVRLMSEIKMVRRWKPRGASGASPGQSKGVAGRLLSQIQLIAIGASTGGPPVLQTILSGLTAEVPVPILIVQHMAPGFVQGFADWLSRSSALPVVVAKQGEKLLPAHVYLAPDRSQMGVARGGRIHLVPVASGQEYGPSVSYLFSSVADVCAAHAVAGLLTGMGRDGARELKRLHNAGAITFAQDEESSVVYGMPGEAVKLGAATYVLSPGLIPAFLLKVLRNTDSLSP